MTRSFRSAKQINDGPDQARLVFLIARGASLSKIQAALSSGADPNQATWQGALPLTVAAQLRRDDLISPLVSAGSRIEERDERGLNALHIASRDGCLATVKALLSQGANPDARSDEGLPIHLAARSRNPTETLGALFDAGANPNAQDGNRRSYLHSALLAGFLQTDEIPLPQNLNPDLIDDQGRRALILALEAKDADLANALLRRGADPEALSPDGFSPLFLARRSGLSSCEGLILALLDARELDDELLSPGLGSAGDSRRDFQL